MSICKLANKNKESFFSLLATPTTNAPNTNSFERGEQFLFLA